MVRETVRCYRDVLRCFVFFLSNLCVVCFVVTDTAAVDILRSLSASGIDFEVRAANAPTSVRLLLLLCHDLFRRRTQYELAEAVWHLVLSAHGDVIATDAAMVALAEDVSALHAAVWHKTQTLFQHTLCLLGFFSGTQ